VMRRHEEMLLKHFMFVATKGEFASDRVKASELFLSEINRLT
jgi:hypothetical protein